MAVAINPEVRMSPRFALFLLLLGPSVALAGSPAADSWSGLRFLIGEWATTSGGGAPGEAISGGFTFGLDLDGHILTRHSHSEYAPKAGETEGVQHSDLLVVFPSAAGLRATYWDNEGHVIQYALTTAEGRVTFESDAAAPGPRFKLVYEKSQRNGLAITFFIARPGGAYQPYVSGVAHRT
jgi:hypothetical protein